MKLEAQFERRPIEYDENEDKCLIEFMKSVEEKSGNSLFIVSPKRLNDFVAAYKHIRKTLSEECKITYIQGTELCKTGWHIKARGKSISILDTQEFAEAVLDNASCFEVTPYADGTIELNVTFYGMDGKGD